jgi:hypothetical protein
VDDSDADGERHGSPGKQGAHHRHSRLRHSVDHVGKMSVGRRPVKPNLETTSLPRKLTSAGQFARRFKKHRAYGYLNPILSLGFSKNNPSGESTWPVCGAA